MADAMIATLTEAAAGRSGPSTVEADPGKPSRIDPCGLRESNFGMMNQLCEGMNNVARHIRPFTVVAWSWKRALALATDLPGASDRLGLIEDFVIRTETLFAWSCILADIPGSQALSPLLKSESYRFGGKHWESLSEMRWGSTGLSAPANYGPGLKNYGWLRQHTGSSELLVPTEQSRTALDAFEAKIAPLLVHPAFSSLGEVDVTAEEAASWASVWGLGDLTEEERDFTARAITGDLSNGSRRDGVSCLLHAARTVAPDAPTTPEGVAAVRRAVSGDIEGFNVPADHAEAAAKWRKLQIRQLFRLAVEGTLGWVLERLQDRPMHGDVLARAFLQEGGIDPWHPAREAWLDKVPASASINEAIADLQGTLREPGMPRFAAAAVHALALCLANAPATAEAFEIPERLPLPNAARQAQALAEWPARELARHVIENWVIAQHVYWAVGRGIQDARGRGNKLARLQVAMEEGGWQAMPNARLRPDPTADRIKTALTLSSQARLI
jgi:hypothetical protein